MVVGQHSVHWSWQGRSSRAAGTAALRTQLLPRLRRQHRAPGTGYEPVSDVKPHAALGQDVAKIKGLLDAAKQGQPVDFVAVGEVFEKGGASKKGDGSARTLATIVKESSTVAFIRDAIAGSGGSAGATDAVRAQRVDKGITVVLAEKVVGELESAAAKVKEGKLEPASGAPHSVDEAWAFFTADGNGPAVTADKRAADFKRPGTVREPVITSLVAAQAAATKGDAAAVEAAATSTRQALDYLFYLATFKYLDADDDTERAEAAAFYRGIQPRVTAADPAADTAITAALTSGDAAAGRAALNSPTVLGALGVDGSEQVTAVP
jgi:Low iron-inducible periplasmic protein.